MRVLNEWLRSEFPMTRLDPSGETARSSPAEVAEVRRPRGLTLRAVLLGLAAVALLTLLSQKLDLWLYLTYVTGGAPPPAQTNVLFLLVLFAVLMVRLGARRWALSRGELLVIYLMMLVGGPISNREGIGFLVCHPVIPYYYASAGNRWHQTFHAYLPSWFGPSDPEVVTGFFHGYRPVPWGAWAVPMLAWGTFYLVLFGTAFCFNALVERQWIARERLTFPLLSIPLEITRGVETPNGVPLLRRGYFWLGAAVPLAVGSLNALHRYFPTIPELGLQYALIPEGTLSPPWTGLGTMDIVLSFPLLAVAFIVPADISLSCWFFHFLTRAENVIGTLYTGIVPNVYTSTFPALYYQGSGAMVMLFLLLCWSARRSFLEALQGLVPGGGKDGTVRRRADEGAREPGHEGAEDQAMSPRMALLGCVGGLLVLAGWLWLAGMSPVTTAWFLGMLFIFLIVFVRVRAETGLGTLLPPQFTNEIMTLPFGTTFFNPRDLTLLQALRPAYRMMGVLWTVQGQLESFKIADEARLPKRRLGWAVGAATMLGFGLAFVLALQLFYRYGFINLPIGMRPSGYPGSQGYWSYSNLAAALSQPSGTDRNGLWGMAAGALLCWTTAILRARFLWFPLHPVGFMSAHSWGMHLNWFPFLLGWAAKVAFVRYGGLTGYHRALPFFIGLLLGAMLNAGLWGLIAWIVGPVEI
jgi:hypothetical protein